MESHRDLGPLMERITKVEVTLQTLLDMKKVERDQMLRMHQENQAVLKQQGEMVAILRERVHEHEMYLNMSKWVVGIGLGLFILQFAEFFLKWFRTGTGPGA